jgi:hypothetical protein
LVVQPAENWAAKNLPGPFDGKGWSTSMPYEIPQAVRPIIEKLAELAADPRLAQTAKQAAATIRSVHYPTQRPALL